MARTLTPERQQLKQQAISLRYDYGLTEPVIASKLQIPQQTINRWTTHNLRMNNTHNNGHITHLEGDCLQLLQKIPDKSIDVLLTDPPYSVMEDYENVHRWLKLLESSNRGIVENSGNVFHNDTNNGFHNFIKLFPKKYEDAAEKIGNLVAR